MAKPAARENMEIRVLSTGKRWRVDCHEIGALETRTAARAASRQAAIDAAQEIATAMRNLDYFGFVRVMVELPEK